ncbi:MAG: phosphatase PAP2 family protein [Clostridia bacterium]|nr:phosphatase PAP2 family protein [Clostridia bacterium]
MKSCMTNEECIKKQRIIIYSVLGAIAAALMVVAAFFDMAINDFMYAPTNFFGVALEVAGVSPFYWVIIFAGAVFFAYTRLLVKSSWNTIKMILSVAACFVGQIIFFHQFTKIWFDSSIIYYLVAAGVSVPFTLLLLWGITRIKEPALKKLAVFALFSVIVCAISMSIVQGVKTVWGRARYREMFKVDDFSAFSKWFVPYGFSTEGDHQSFPSGHTASAGAIMVIAALPEFFNILKKHEWLLFCAGLLVTLSVALSRIIVGAHFLSDVVMASVISVATYAIVRSIFFKRWKGAIKSIDN